jgi:hypothetical protein
MIKGEALVGLIFVEILFYELSMHHVVVFRFRVKVEVSDGDSTSVFVLFDSDMSYILEKACAHFVGKAKVYSLFNISL